MNRLDIQNQLKPVAQDLRQILQNCNHDNTDGNQRGIQQILEELEEILLEMEQTNRILLQTSTQSIIHFGDN